MPKLVTNLLAKFRLQLASLSALEIQDGIAGALRKTAAPDSDDESDDGMSVWWSATRKVCTEFEAPHVISTPVPHFPSNPSLSVFF
jgi:hypothetical protein